MQCIVPDFANFFIPASSERMPHLWRLYRNSMRIPRSLRAAIALGLGTALLIPAMAHAQKPAASRPAAAKKAAPKVAGAFTVEAEAFADLQLLRFQIPGFSTLTPKQRELAYYLY